MAQKFTILQLPLPGNVSGKTSFSVERAKSSLQPEKIKAVIRAHLTRSTFLRDLATEY